MDGTLYDTEMLSGRAWVRACAEFGYELTLRQTCGFHGHNARDNETVFKKLFGPDAPYWEIRRVRYRYMMEVIERDGVPVKPGVFELFRVLRDKGIKICVATGTQRDTAEDYWRRTGVDAWLDASVCGDEITRSKPDPEVFLKAAEAVGTDPRACVVFEDSPFGIRGAKTAGCMAVMIPDMDPADDDMRKTADLVLPSLLDAARLAEESWPAVTAAPQE